MTNSNTRTQQERSVTVGMSSSLRKHVKTGSQLAREREVKGVKVHRYYPLRVNMAFD